MSESYDLIIKGGDVVTPNGTEKIDVGVKGGRIVALGDLKGATSMEEYDATGQHVLPGAIDTQVHFREPGLEHKEDLACGTAAAALGGIVAIFEMPNTNPNTLGPVELADKLARCENRAWTDHAFFIGAAEENVDELGELEKLPGCAGIKIFMGSSTGSLLVEEEGLLVEVLKNGTRRCPVHAEDENRLRERFALVRDGAEPTMHPVWRDPEAAVLATTRICRLARQTGRRVHVLHVTSKDEMPILAANKDLVTVETTPQHLTLSAPGCYEELGTFAQMNPPIRDEEHRLGLWEGIRTGIVDVLGSDHAPHTLEEKQKPYPASPSGMPGVQTLMPLMLDHVNKGNLSLERLVDLTASGPARIYNIAGKGRIACGFDADFTIVDMNKEETISKDWLAYKCGWSPFEGVTVKGWPMATIIRGSVVMKDGELIGDPQGKPVRFTDTEPAKNS
ncbi:dihydroorotase [Kiloniella sp. EL199]|uniref:dihydroorotase n=1 Tax=Kiloniella sp. EL199 TaxID=2107581 RepID=UPI000EA34C1E|nr:dihydroorotase [Kiloniella sp. EL199]